MDVGRVVIERRQGADHAAHDGHRMRVAAEAAEEADQLFMHHRVIGDVLDPIGLLLLVGQFAILQQIGDFEKIAFVRQLIDGIAAMQQNAFIAVDEGDFGFARPGRGVSRVKVK